MKQLIHYRCQAKNFPCISNSVLTILFDIIIPISQKKEAETEGVSEMPKVMCGSVYLQNFKPHFVLLCNHKFFCLSSHIVHLE